MEKHLMKKMLLKNQNKALSWLFYLASLQAALKVYNYCIPNIATSLLPVICYNYVVASVFLFSL
jgi:hypothetical protein